MHKVKTLFAYCQDQAIPVLFTTFLVNDEWAIKFKHLPCASHYIGYDADNQPVFRYAPKDLLPDKDYIFVIK